jgi:hypothetical protein
VDNVLDFGNARYCTCNSSNVRGKEIRNTRDKLSDYHFAGICKVNGGITQRHDNIVKEFATMLRQAGLTPHVEPRGLYTEKPKSGADIIVSGLIAGDYDRKTAFDVTIVHPAAYTYLQGSGANNNSSTVDLYAAKDAIARKCNKFKNTYAKSGVSFHALAFEVTGAFSEPVVDLIKSAARIARDRTGVLSLLNWSRSQFEQYWFARISCAVQRYTANIMLDGAQRVQGSLTHDPVAAVPLMRNAAQARDIASTA